MSRPNNRYQVATTALVLVLTAGAARAQDFLVPNNAGEVVVSSCDGTIYDPGGPGNYMTGNGGELVVYPSKAGAMVELELISLDIDPADILHLGVDGSSPLAKASNGTLVVGQRYVSTTAASGRLEIDFSNLGSANRPGFEFRIRCAGPGPLRMGDDRIHFWQGLVFTDSGGSSQNYANGEALVTEFRGQDYTQLDFYAVDIEPCCDQLEIFGFAGFSQGTLPGATTVFADSELTAEFTSDSSVTGSGWEAEVRSYIVMENLGFTDVVSHGSRMINPGGPPGSTYPGNLDYEHALAAHNDELDLAFDLFDVQLGPGDTLEIRGGNNSSAPLLASLQAGDSGGFFQLPSSRELYLNLHTDAAGHGSFSGVFVETLPMTMGTRTAIFCDRTFSDSGGLIGAYGNNENNVLVMYPENPSTWMEIEFATFGLEPNIDFLSVYDGDSTSAPLIGQFTGSTLPPKLSATKLPGSPLTLSLVSDGSVVGSGFSGVARCSFNLFQDGFESGSTSAWTAAVP
jgi:hypothetical protein